MAQSTSQSGRRASRAAFAWQGWNFLLPALWNPVKLEGTFDSGHALFADLQRPRLAMRWRKTGGRRFDPDKWAQTAMRGEVGQLATEEARKFPLDADRFEGSLIYQEPHPPGRDVWVGYSPISGRAIEVIYHSRRRERILPDIIMPTLIDLPADRPMPWSVFELSCVVPTGFVLAKHLLNAGDLSLTFHHRRERLTVRQVAVATLALQRMRIDLWLQSQEKNILKHYRARSEHEEVEHTFDGRRLVGIQRIAPRRRRFSWAFFMPPSYLTMVLRDQEYDRLVIIQSTSADLAAQVLPTVGWAREKTIDQVLAEQDELSPPATAAPGASG